MSLLSRMIYQRAFEPVALDDRAVTPLEEKSPNHDAPVLNPFFNNSPIFPTGDYFVFSEQAYQRNELIYRGIRILCDSVAGAPLSVYDANGAKVKAHPIRQLIRKPNPFMGEHMLWTMTVLHMMLSGNAFWEKVRDANGNPVELWLLRPDRVRIIPSNENFIDGYIYEIAGHRYPLDTADIVHFKFPHPLYDYWGLSPLQPAIRRIAIDNEQADFIKVTLQNYGVPPAFITIQERIDADTVRRLDAQTGRWGGRNRGKFGYLQAGMDIKVVGQAMKDLVMPELDAMSQKRVLASIGIPPILLGQEATYANYAEARASMYEDVVIPLQSMLDDKIESDLLFADFDSTEKYALGFDTSEVPALRPVRQTRWDNAVKGFAAGMLTLNSALRIVGEQPVPDGDVFVRPMSSTTVPANPADDADIETDEDEDADGADEGKAIRRLLAMRFDHKIGKRDLEHVKKVVLKRSALADRYQKKVKSWAQTEFKRQAREVKRAITKRQKALTADQVAAISAELDLLTTEWAARSSQDITPILAGLMMDAGDAASTAELGVKFDLSNADVIDFIRKYAFKFADKISSTSAGDVREILTEAETEGWSLSELSEHLQDKFEAWDSTRADMIARTETIRAANAGALESYKQAGITRKVWIADGDACPYCAGLDGTVISIDEPFLEQGTKYQPDGAKTPLSIDYEDVDGPPAHPNCRCAVRAEVD